MTADDQRLRRARRGDVDAFNELIAEHQALVYNVCHQMLGSREEAEDASQEAFISAWRHFGSLRGDAFRPWLLRIASNTCRDVLRRRKRRPQTSLDVALDEGMPDPPDEAPSPEKVLLTVELRGQIQRALIALPEDQRLAVVLCDIEGLDYGEIAAVIKTSLGTVKSRISRGRARLRELLKGQAEPLTGAGRPE